MVISSIGLQFTRDQNPKMIEKETHAFSSSNSTLSNATSSPLKQESFFPFCKNHQKKLACLVVTVVAAFFLNKFIHMEYPSEHLPLDKADPNRIMAHYIHHSRDIDWLAYINGVSIGEIEKRARPGPGCWSHTGFLGENESFKEVLKKDWKTVELLGLTHHEIADHLGWIINYPQGRRRNERIVEYDFRKLDGNTMNAKAPVQVFEIEPMPSRGWQDDIFFKLDCVYGEDDYCHTDNVWSADYTIRNLKNNASVFVSGGHIGYIRSYGFYEGGDDNPYRVDPIRLVGVLTGLSYSTLDELVKSKQTIS